MFDDVMLDTLKLGLLSVTFPLHILGVWINAHRTELFVIRGTYGAMALHMRVVSHDFIPYRTS